MDAMTDINDSYIQDACNFSKPGKVVGFSRLIKRGAAAAVIAAALLGTTVYGAALLVKQLHMEAYDSPEEMAAKHGIPEWNSVVAVQGTVFEEQAFENLEKQSLIDILTSAEGQSAEEYFVEHGTSKDSWNRKLVSYVERESYNKVYYEAYEYPNLSDALEEYQIALSLDYIQMNYPAAAGEYGCDFLYADDKKDHCLTQRFFSGYKNEKGNFVSVEYSIDETHVNENSYVIFDGKADTGYFITDDGVEVFLTKARGTKGGSFVTAYVYTEHSILYVGMYGDFSEEEIEQILNSLDIAKGMNLDVR